MQEIFASMNKTDAASQKMNCESCGYSSCRNMARAIYNGCKMSRKTVYIMSRVLRRMKRKDPESDGRGTEETRNS